MSHTIRFDWTSFSPLTTDDLVKTCRVYKVNLAFSWVAVGVATIILLYTIYVANSGDGAVRTTDYP